MKTSSEGMKIIARYDKDYRIQDVQKAEKAVIACVRIELNEHQFSALVSLALNITPTEFKRGMILTLLNKGQVLMAAQQFDDYVLIQGKVSKTLTKRRAEEKRLFLKPELVINNRKV